MANTYGVTPADIAAELPGIVPGGFGAGTNPTTTLVQAWIDAVDLEVTIAIQDVAAAVPAASDRIALLVKRVIIERVKAMVMRVVYTGNQPADVAAATAPYEVLAASALAGITALGAQAAGVGDPVNRIRASDPGDTVRDLIVQDVDLNPGPAGKMSGYSGGRRMGQF